MNKPSHFINFIIARTNVLVLGDVGHILSLLFLTLAIIVFLCNQSLLCGRVTVHINMFLSLIFSNVFWLLWGHTILNDAEVWAENSIWCRLFNALMMYFTMSTYFWMMCEGAYLQMLLFNTFDNDHRRLRLLCCLGWGLPGLAILPYSLFRFVNMDTNCWMDLGDSAWFIGIPVVIIMVVNLLMLVNVIVMIRAKIQQDCLSGGRRNSISVANFKQLTPLCVLFPVLGIHFFLVPARPEHKSQYEHSYDLLLTISSSFQGMIHSQYKLRANVVYF